MDTFATELSCLRRAVHSQYKERAFVPYQIWLDILKMKAHRSKVAANNSDLFTPRTVGDGAETQMTITMP
jgi:hypothetical protein